jgi:hypothetical protein
LPQLAPGYLATPQAALAMLAALERRGVAVNPAMKAQIGRLDKLSPGLAEHP